MNIITKLDLTTAPPLAQNPCCVSVGLSSTNVCLETEQKFLKTKKRGEII